jgi:hypothetical protein
VGLIWRGTHLAQDGDRWRALVNTEAFQEDLCPVELVCSYHYRTVVCSYHYRTVVCSYHYRTVVCSYHYLTVVVLPMRR